MKLTEILSLTKEKGKMAYIDGWAMGIRYHEPAKSYCYCWGNGDFVYFRNNINENEIKKVILCDKILFNDKWEIVNFGSKYNVGDKFLYNDICIIKITNECESTTAYNKCIMTVKKVFDINSIEARAILPIENDNRYVYDLSFDTYSLILPERSLNKLEKIN